MKGEILTSVSKLEGLMVGTLSRLCSFPAISPHNGGTGEDAKILELAKIIDELGLKGITLRVEHVDDEKAQSGRRPSLFLEYPGKKSQRLCILSHIDVVPEGDRSAWTLDPFKPEVRGSRLYGRGVSDNGMCLVSSLFALKAVQDAGI
ncbi:MAG: M20/M25/M40 family metallo-hydrolase, partial [Synergistaceae bacterium]|nr:M20/M25/M40 family metallo-hydrolase [Synergistaceae bacterium]